MPMDFEEVLGQVREQLAREKRIAYRLLKRRFQLDDEDIEDLKADLIDAKRLAVDEDGKVLVWVGAAPVSSSMDAVHRYEGYVAQSMGDGIFALFGAPIAHEDHPQRALYAALLMQEESRKQAERLRREKGINFQIRVGVNTGEVVLRSIRKDDLHTDYIPVGYSTNLASRMESLATPGSIVASEYTHKLTEGYFEFKPLGPAQVKGFHKPIHIYEVSGVGPLRTKLQVAARRGLVRFVGRQNEMDQLRRALELATAGHGQIVGVMGEPGVGKSRLFYEFVAAYGRMPQPGQRECLILETFSVSHGKAYPYLPLIELLKNYFQLALHDDERIRREKITGRVLTLDRLAIGTVLRGWALAMQGQHEEGLAQMHEGLTAHRATGTELLRPVYCALLAEVYGKMGQAEEGLKVLTETLTLVNQTGERLWEAELYRLKGTLTLKQSGVRSPESEVNNPQSAIRNPQLEAEACFLKAIDIAQRQQAKSLELRATVSLARLRQQQGRYHEASNLLSEIYNWFTEGFDTVDLQEAKALLKELG
ncbi:MAG: AAA family ATPase [Deltaproteobacteria bacterium]|nr:AAA family ATPase [Deltaproteobacteria bacterium]